MRPFLIWFFLSVLTLTSAKSPCYSLNSFHWNTVKFHYEIYSWELDFGYLSKWNDSISDLITANMIESKSFEVELKDAEPDIIEQLVEFAYTAR